MVGFESKLNRAPSVSMKVPVTNLLLVMNVIVTKMNVPLKEHNHVFAHAQEFDF